MKLHVFQLISSASRLLSLHTPQSLFVLPALFAVLGSVLSSCETATTHAATDMGHFCLNSSNPANSCDAFEFAANRSVSVFVDFEICASACAPASSASCSTSRDEENENEIFITAQATWHDPEPNQSCPTLCLPVVAECATEALAEGEYVFHYGAHSLNVSVPSHLARVCSNNQHCCDSDADCLSGTCTSEHVCGE